MAWLTGLVRTCLWGLDPHQHTNTRCTLQALRRPEPPAALAALFSAELYGKTQAYSLDKWWVEVGWGGMGGWVGGWGGGGGEFGWGGG